MAQDQKQGIYITQEDIDTALAAAPRPEEMFDGVDGKPLFLDETDIVDSGLDGDSQGDDFFGLLSKDDIEALLHGDLGGSGGREAQDEVDALLQTTGKAEESPASEEAAVTDKKKTAQEDVEQLIQGAGEALEAAGETAEKAKTKASEADAAVSQGDIDRLLMEALDESEDEPETADGSAPSETGEVISQGDLDQLLADALADDGQDVEPEISEAAPIEPDAAPESPDDTELAAPEAASESLMDTGSLISQSDLDQLLEGNAPLDGAPDATAGDAKGTSEHISQDDINRLLKESLDEADDLLDEEPEPEIADESDFQEPVILAEDEASSEPPPSVEKTQAVEKIIKTSVGKERKKRVWENRLVWAAAAGIVLFVSIAAMMMSSGPTEQVAVPKPKVLTFSLSQGGDGISQAPVLSQNSIRFPGFVVLVPSNSAAVTYVTADLTLDFSDASTVAVIKENKAFVRDIIYGAISSELMTRDISAIDEISLEQAIRKALGQIVAREAIGRIAFDRFQLV